MQPTTHELTGPPPDEVKEGKAVSFSIGEENREISQDEQDIIDQCLPIIGEAADIQVILDICRATVQRGRTLKNCPLDEVVDRYFLEITKKESPRSVTPLPPKLAITGTAENPVTIGTSTNEDEDMEKAIEESKREAHASGKVPTENREDLDMKKAIEESLATNNGPLMNSYLKSMPENPHDMGRQEYEWTGLHNIGNSCWFNVLAQLLFNIPELRRIIYEAPPAEWLHEGKWNGNTETVTEKDYLLSLRRLFAEMDGSMRKYVDPTETVTILSALLQLKMRKNGENVEVILGRQQDAVEMLIKALEWLEIALIETKKSPLEVKVDCVPSDISMDETELNQINNPIADQPMVTPQLRMEVSPAPATSTNTINDQHFAVPDHHFAVPDLPDMSSQVNGNIENELVAASSSQSEPAYPLAKLFHGLEKKIKDGALNVPSETKNSVQLWNLNVSYQDLHDSLEAAQFNNDAGGEETWYDELPAVLVFCPARFRYQFGRTKKMHNEFKFYDKICMDRYISRNYDRVKSIRESRKAQRQRLAQVKAEIKGFEEFPMENNKTEKLNDALKGTLRFVGGPSEQHDAASNSTGSGWDTGFPETSPSEASTFPLPGPIPVPTFGPANRHESINNSNKEIAPPSSFVDTLNTVLPGIANIMPNDKERDVLKAMLQQLLDYSEDKERNLRSEAELLHNYIEDLFNVEGLQNESYHLHGLAIHEGDANVGHYWAYVRDMKNPDNWHKLNDKTVDVVGWAQMEKDAIGGVSNSSSAYAFIYVSDKANWLFDYDRQETSGYPARHSQDIFAKLPNDLRLYVNSTNEEYEAAVKKWDMRANPHGRRANTLRDSEHSRSLLSKDVHPFLSDEDRVHLQNQAQILNKVLRTNGKDYTYDGFTLNQAKNLYNDIGSHIVACINKKIPQMESKNNEERARVIYEKCLTEWFEIFEELEPHNNKMLDPRSNLMDFCRAMGHKMPAKVHQYIVSFCLQNCTDNNEELKNIAQTERERFLQNPKSQDHIVWFEWCSNTYALLAYFWALVKQCFQKSFPFPGFNTMKSEDSIEMNRANLERALDSLKWATIMWRMYETLLSQTMCGPNKAIIDHYLVNSLLLIPFVIVNTRLCIALHSGVRTEDLKLNEIFFPIVARVVMLGVRGDSLSKMVMERIENLWTLTENTMPTISIEQNGRFQDLHKKFKEAIALCATGNMPSLTEIVVQVTAPNVMLDIEHIENVKLDAGLVNEEEAKVTVQRITEQHIQTVCTYFFKS